MKCYFTQAGFKKLNLEVSRLEAQLRGVQSSSGEIAELGGNAWHDNAGYDNLVINLRGVNRRRSDIEEIKNNAVVIEPPINPKVIGLGTWVTLEQDGERTTFGIVGYGQSDLEKKLIAYDTPLAKILKGLEKSATKEGRIGPELHKFVIIDIETLTPEHEGVET